MKINTIVFDLGGVLIHWDPHIPFIKAFGSEEKARWFIANICNHDWNVQMDAGKPFAVAIAEKTAEFPEYAAYIRMYGERWKETIIGPIPHAVDVLNRLKERNGHRLFAITNWSGETFPYARERFDFLGYFEDIAVSGELKMRKPFREIFDFSIDQFDLVPEQSLFIDDSLPNIEMAKSLGFQVIHLPDPNKLEEEIRKFGIVI